MLSLFWPCVSFHRLFEAISAFLFFLSSDFLGGPQKFDEISWLIWILHSRFRQICVDLSENMNCKRDRLNQIKTHFFGDKIAFLFRVHNFFRFVFIPRNLRSTRGTLKSAPYKLEKLPHSEYNLKNHSRPFT